MNNNTFPGTVILLLSLAGLYYVIFSSDIQFDAKIFPILTLAIVAICGIVLIIKGFTSERAKPLPSFNWKKISVLILLALAYAFSLEFLGFIVASLIFLPIYLFVAGVRRVITITSIS